MKDLNAAQGIVNAIGFAAIFWEIIIRGGRLLWRFL